MFLWLLTFDAVYIANITICIFFSKADVFVCVCVADSTYLIKQKK